LDATEGAGDVGEAEVKADVWMMEPIEGGGGAFCRVRIGSAALIAKAAETVGVGLGVGQNSSPFAGGDLLIGVEAKDGEVPEGADAALLKFGADGFAGIFEDDETMTRGESAESGHVGGDAEGVDDEDGSCARGDQGLDGRGGQIECDGVYVRKNRLGMDMEYSVSDSDESERGDDDFVAIADAEGKQGDMKACGAAADGDGVGGAVEIGERGFEGSEFGSEAEMGSAQDGADGGDFSFGDVGSAERDRRSHG